MSTVIRGENLLTIGSSGNYIKVSAPVSPPVSGPPITTNLQFYYNADADVYSDAIGTAAVDGDNIRQVLDQSTNSNTLNQTDGLLQPLYKTTVLGNGNASIESLNDSLFFTNLITPGTTVNFSFYLVYKRNSTNSTPYVLRGTYLSTYPLLNFLSTTVDWRVPINGGTAARFNYTGTTNLEIACWTFDRSIGEGKMYIDNQLIQTYSVSASRDFTSFDRIFSNSQQIANYGSSLMYYDAHDATQVGQVSDWLNTKYIVY